MLLVFLGLGLTSFGGPIAHIGYFRRALVERRAWLSEAAFADIVALCQFLPGPASSQAGFAVGVARAGFWGGVAAWTGFTLPSALLMVAFAYSQPYVGEGALGAAAIHGLGAGGRRCGRPGGAGDGAFALRRPEHGVDRRLRGGGGDHRPVALGQPAAIAVGALAGLVFCRGPRDGSLEPRPRRPAIGALVASLVVFALLFLPGVLVLHGSPAAMQFHAFYKSGALVFGGGHVVLPLLRDQVVAPGWVSDRAFLSGYGAAQALPGPLFSFAAYLGALSRVGGGPARRGRGPGRDLSAGTDPGRRLAPHWRRLRHMAVAQAVMRGVNASVVGILGMAFYNPVWITGVRTPADLSIAVCAFVLLTAWKAPPLAVVAACVAASVGLVSL